MSKVDNKLSTNKNQYHHLNRDQRAQIEILVNEVDQNSKTSIEPGKFVNTGKTDFEEENELIKQTTILYVFLGEFSKKYFESEREWKDYCEKSHDPFPSICIIEYIGDFAGKDDVIKYRNFDGERYLAACDDVSYYDYQANQDNHDIFNWQQLDGSIEWMYEAFRDKGIIFKNDVYARIREEDQKLINAINQAFKNLF